MATITITNPRICEFYQTRPHLNMETMNLKLLELLESIPNDAPSQNFTNIFNNSLATCSANNEWKISLSELKDVLMQIHQTWIMKFIGLKTEYIYEIKSFVLEKSSLQHFGNEHNTQYIQKCWNVLFSCIPENTMKHKLSYIYEKFQFLFKQYSKTLQSNIDTAITRGLDVMLSEYIQIYENNTSHCVQSIHQIMMDFISGKEEIANKFILNSQQSTSLSSQLSRLNYEIKEILQCLKTPNTQYHPPIETLISQIYPTSSISIYMEDGQTHHGYTVLRANNQSTLYIQSMDMKERNVSIEETKQFTKTIQALNVNGVLISQNTGITSKPNYHIDIVNNKVVVFLHQMNYSPEKLQMAIDMIDHIFSKLCEFNISPENKFSIPKETLEDINREYQSFINQKEVILNFVKDTNRKLISQLEEITFPQLDVFLLTKFSSCKKQGYTCDLCHQFTVGTLKGLAAHKRGCNRKHGLTSSSSQKPESSPVTQSL